MKSKAIKITGVQVALCSLPLPKPVLLGSVRIEAREYVCLKISTDSGIDGFSIGYRSGGQSLESLAALAPKLIGRDPFMRNAVGSELESLLVPAKASYLRALSLIDIALWDITAKAAGSPLYVLLGGSRTEVPSVPVLGFSYSERPVTEIQEEIARHHESGEALVKVMIKGNAAAENAGYIEQLTSACSARGSLAVDAHWSWRTISEALDTCRRIDDCGLAFIEDPFLPQQWRLAAELRGKIRTPLAVGEDVLDLYSFADLCQSVDILRVDATTIGGISAAMAALSLAASQGRKALPHVFPYLHLQLACANKTAMAVEYIPEHTGTDPIRSLMNGYPTIKAGNFVVSDEPGAGCDLNWDAVATCASTTRSFE